jgi:hypothetical protein
VLFTQGSNALQGFFKFFPGEPVEALCLAIGQKKAWISVFVGAEDRFNSCKLVGSERYGFLRRNSWERSAVQFPLDLLFPTELLRFEPFKFGVQRLFGPFFEETGANFGVPPDPALAAISR